MNEEVFETEGNPLRSNLGMDSGLSPLRPAVYSVYVNTGTAPWKCGTPVDFSNPLGIARLAAMLSSIVTTSDASPGTCTFTMMVPESTALPVLDEEDGDGNPGPGGTELIPEDGTVPTSYGIPAIGTEVAVLVSDMGDEELQEKIMFKGYVSEHNESGGESGREVSITCFDMKGRMMDEYIKKSYNRTFDTASKPNFSEKDKYEKALSDERWDVGRIIEDIFETADVQTLTIDSNMKPLVYFDNDHVIYPEESGMGSGVGSSSGEDVDNSTEPPKLEDFVPGTLSFDNISVMEAVYRTISAAGSYRIVYDPVKDNLVFTKISLDADSAGDFRLTVKASTDKTSPNRDYAQDSVEVSYDCGAEIYNGTVNVISDNSSRALGDMANLYRMYSNFVEFYTGHYYVSKSHPEYTAMSFSERSEANDDSRYYLGCKNWDGYEYHMPTYALTFKDDVLTEQNPRDKDAFVIVGCPLYPQWNPLKGYDAYETKLSKVRCIPKEWSPASDKLITHSDYDYAHNASESLWEREGVTILDKKYIRSRTFMQVMGSNDFNISLGYTYEAWFPWPGPCLHCGGTGAVHEISQDVKDRAMEIFGNSRDAKGEIVDLGLVPFNFGLWQDRVVGKDKDGNDITEQVPTNHPVPWLNTCPACRGNGREPMFKITNIVPRLCDVPPSKVKVEDFVVQSSSDRTWNETVRDLVYNYDAQVQLETDMITRESPVAEFKNDDALPPHPLAGTQSKTDKKISIFPSDEKIKRLYRTQITINPQCTIDYVRGNVVFRERAGVMCERAMKTIKTHHFKMEDGRVRYFLKDKSDANATLYDSNSFTLRQEAYWRPSRAWITCFFRRERYYDRWDETMDSGAANPRRVRYQDAGIADSEIEDSSNANYTAGCRIDDGRYVLEINKRKPSEQLEFDKRPIVKAMVSDEFTWQVCPYDMYRLPVPLKAGDNWDPQGILKVMKSANYFFSSAALQISEPLRETEFESFSDDVKSTIYEGAIGRNEPYAKKIAFILRDDRFRLVERAIKDLEKRNNYQISGNITVRGTNFSLENGLGYVRFTDDAKACIVKMQHSFSNGYTTSLELSTEELRVGEEKEYDKDYRRLMESKMNQYLFGDAGYRPSGGKSGSNTDSEVVEVQGNSPVHQD